MKVLRHGLPLLALTLVAVSLANAQTPLRLRNVTPCRLVDTRQLNNGNGFQGTMSFNLPSLAQAGGVGGRCAPFSLSTAQAYSLNVTLVTVSGHPVGYLTIFPTGETQPLVSLMNSDGRIKANAAIVPAGTNGAVSVYVTDAANVLIDIDAYFDPASDTSALAFFPLPPCRIVDTRNGQDGGTLHAGQERDYTIPGTCGVPASASAYSFNVTVLPTQGELDYLTVWPKGQTQPVVSTLNDGTGTLVANAAIVPAGADNATAFYPHDHNTDLLLDVNGYFAPASSASNPLSLYTVTPCRILDTRNGIGLFQGAIPVGIVGSGCGIPGASPEAFVLNATVVPPGPLLYLQLWPEGGDQEGSTLNANDGAITSNMAIVPAGTGNDSISAYASSNTQLILDVSSYFAPIAPLMVENSTLPNGTLNDGYSVQLTAAGGVAPYSWQRTSGNLPTGLTLTATGLIHGNTTATGTFPFMVNATDSNSPASSETVSLQITVNSTQGALAVTTTSLSAGTVNTPYNALLAANGGVTPYTWSITAGTLPAGLSLNTTTGLITGTPQAGGLSYVTFKVTDAQSHTAMQQLAVVVNTGDANGSLNGNYALSFTGYADGYAFVWAGSFVADGNGNITGGIYDENCACGLSSGAQLTGTYSISSNGLGSIIFNGGTYNLLIAVGNGQGIRIIALNEHGSTGVWGAGVIRQQNPTAFNTAALAGNWAFGYQGFDSALHPLAGDGTYHADASGNLSGSEDVNDFGTDNQLMFTARPTSNIDAYGRAIVQYQVSGVGTLNLAVYVVSANQTLGIEVDNLSQGGSLLVTDGRRQSGTFNNGILHGNAVGRGSRQAHANSSPVSQAVVLLLTFDGNGNVTENQYTNTGGVFAQSTGMTTYSVASNGRALLSPGSSQVVCYVVQRNEAFCINSGSNAAGAGLVYFEPQAAGPFNNASLSGEYLGGSLPQYVSGTDSTIDNLFLDGLGNGTVTSSQSGPDGTTQNQMGSGTYSIAGNGSFTLSQNGSAIAYGYVVGPGKFELISLDDNPRLLIEVTSSAP